MTGDGWSVRGMGMRVNGGVGGPASPRSVKELSQLVNVLPASSTGFSVPSRSGSGMPWLDKAIANSGGYGPPISAAPTSSYYTPTGREAQGGWADMLGKLSAGLKKKGDEAEYLDAPKADMKLLDAIMGQKLQAFGNFAVGGMARDAIASAAGMAALMPGSMQGQATGMPQATPLAPLRAAAGMFVSGGAGNGTSDEVPAKLSVGEFVIPADVVSAAGNGSSEAGAQYFTDLIQQLRQSHMANMANMPPPR